MLGEEIPDLTVPQFLHLQKLDGDQARVGGVRPGLSCMIRGAGWRYTGAGGDHNGEERPYDRNRKTPQWGGRWRP